jgi:hypothetical protein
MPNVPIDAELEESLHDLGAGLTDKQLSLRPFCYVCNWRKGGIDSWNGSACKCGKQAPTFGELFDLARTASAAISKASGALKADVGD